MNENIMKMAGFGDMVRLVKQGKCPFCQEEVKEENFKDKPEIFLREFRISGICYPCQLETFKTEDE